MKWELLVFRRDVYVSCDFNQKLKNVKTANQGGFLLCELDRKIGKKRMAIKKYKKILTFFVEKLAKVFDIV